MMERDRATKIENKLERVEQQHNQEDKNQK